MLDDPSERGGPVHQVVLVAAVTVALTVRVVLVDNQFLSVGENLVRGLHGINQNHFCRSVPSDSSPSVSAFRDAQLGVGMVHVVAGSIGQDCVDQMGFDLGGQRADRGEAPYIYVGRLVKEVPPDPGSTGAAARLSPAA